MLAQRNTPIRIETALITLLSLSACSMLNCALPLESKKRGALLIGVGLAVVAVAQWQAGVPIAAAIVLIGWGALLSIASGPRSGSLGLLNLPVYGCLGSFAIASQTHAALNSDVGQLSLLLLVDHTLAMVLIVGLTIHTVRGLLPTSADTR
jgi:hypothetical protein